MERLYALGVTCIEFVQYWFQDWEPYFELANQISNPHNAMEVMFPLVSIVDSVFAAQLLLCLAFGGWLNAVMKWWLLEDRPYWWVQETTFYSTHRPHIHQNSQSCETGPGSPSGHSTTAAMIIVLTIMWISHVINDRKYNLWWWKYIVYPLSALCLGLVMVARLFVGTHFPHQCLLGALIGTFLAPALCIYVTDPFVWRYGYHGNSDVTRVVGWHVTCAVITAAISLLTYYSLVYCGVDPQWTVQLAFRWCASPSDIHVSTTPVFALVQSCAALLGAALAVTPALARYRHYTKQRSLVISALSTGAIVYIFRNIQDNICKSNALWYYTVQFALAAVKPILLLRLSPALAMWPFETGKTKIE